MKTVYKLFVLLMVVALLAACGATEAPTEPPKPDPTKAPAEPTKAPVNLQLALLVHQPVRHVVDGRAQTLEFCGLRAGQAIRLTACDRFDLLDQPLHRHDHATFHQESANQGEQADVGQDQDGEVESRFAGLGVPRHDQHYACDEHEERSGEYHCQSGNKFFSEGRQTGHHIPDPVVRREDAAGQRFAASRTNEPGQVRSPGRAQTSCD